jgi:ParB family transcriptional regulator, chromosome partitioning protein
MKTIPNPRRRNLGRGLSALIPDQILNDSGHAVSGVLRTVGLESIQPNPEQPRRHFDKTALEELASSIREHGILTPLVVRPVGPGRYLLIAGERRWRAAGLAALQEVPVVVRHDAEDESVQLALALVENLQREDLDPIECAWGYRRLIDDHGFTQEQVARKVGKTRTTIANAMRLLRLPEGVQNLLREGRITTGHAKALLAVDDPETLREILSQVLARDLSVRATERLVRAQVTVTRTVQVKERRERVLDYASQLLTRALNTSVAIQPKKRGSGGRISIEYYNNEDLERLIGALRGDE